MRNVTKLATVAILLSTLPAFATTHPKTKKATASSVRQTSAAKKPAAAKHVDAMAPERATAIQSALIKQGYLQGEPSGAWDSDSTAAMQKFQSDHGWQTKFTPDARALNKLGLNNSTDAQ